MAPALGRPEAQPLADLTELDRSLLHIWVAGPGTGEGIAIALPERGWVLIDGCRTDADATGEKLPLRHLLTRYRGEDDPIALMVLTHPHADHADGFGELVGELTPEQVALASPPSTGKPALLAAYRDTVSNRAIDAEGERREGQIASAVRAMNAWSKKVERPVSALHDGVQLDLGGVSLHVRAPTADQVAARLDGETPTTMGRVANAMSLVLEVEYGELRLVLGGDLPTTHGGSNVPEGWNSVLKRHPHLAPATRLKVPHHGSREALHADLLAVDGVGTWWVTPFARQGLPRGQKEEGQAVIEGMAQMLSKQNRVQVTSLPTARSKQRHLQAAGSVSQSQWNEAFVAKDLGGAFAAMATEIGPQGGVEPNEAIWAASFDQQGVWTARWRGPIALDVVRDAPSL